MKYTISILAFFLFFYVQAQDPFLQKDHDAIENQAFKLTNQYNKELALDGDQYILFEKKVEEFLIRRKKIEAEYKGKEKLDLIYELQQTETAEMNDILTRPQLQVYKRIKPQIQPLEVVKEL